MVSRRIEGAQKKVEERNFDVRKNLLEYDEVMDFQRKSVYGYRQRILNGANCKLLILSMIDSQIDRNLETFLDKDYGAAAFASWASSQLGIEFEAKMFRSSSFEQAQEYAIDYARRISESQVLDAVDENLPDDAEESEWNWQALAKTANMQWKAAIRDSDLKRIGRDNVAEFLIEKAHKFVDHVDLGDGKQYLEPNYGVKVAINWIKAKFDITLEYDKVKDLDLPRFDAHLREMTHKKYYEKEVQFPVLGGLMHFTVRDQHGKRYDRESLVEWAKQRFGIELSLDDLKNKQRNEIEETMFAECRKGLEVVPEKYQKLHKELDRLLQGQDFVELEEIQQKHETIPHPASPEAVAENQQRTKYDQMIRLDTSKLGVEQFCKFMASEFEIELTPEKLGQWDVRDLEDRLTSLIEDKFNPEMRRMERSLVLQVLDTAWKEHLLAMDHLRSSVGLRSYAQEDPKVVFKREGMSIFETMWDSIFQQVTDLIFRMEQLDPNFVRSTWTESEAVHEEVATNSSISDIASQQEAAIEGTQNANRKPEPIRNLGPKLGRNDPCHCGSGKKYKNCHMKK
ncbi:MAG: SEC-C metal-binding domain-containing protein [Planctomycetaceae bacterium]|nr:SEC-C metal-binding domain-containing protein [Planctomycetaceae bacterium]